MTVTVSSKSINGPYRTPNLIPPVGPTKMEILKNWFAKRKPLMVVLALINFVLVMVLVGAKLDAIDMVNSRQCKVEAQANAIHWNEMAFRGHNYPVMRRMGENNIFEVYTGSIDLHSGAPSPVEIECECWHQGACKPTGWF